MNRTRRRRLAILAPLKAWGGIERKMLILCREFAARGVEVEFILTRGGQVPYPDEFPGAVRVVDLHSRGKLDAVPRLIRHLRRSRPDAVLTAKDHAAKVAVVARLLGRIDTRVVVKVTTTLSQTLRRPWKRRLAGWLYPRADAIIAISQGVADDLMRLFAMDAGRVRVIYNPMVTPDMEARAALPAPHAWLQGDGPPVLIAAGRLAAGKAFDKLIEAFAQVRETRPCRLVILGEGPERARLEARARELSVQADVLLPGYQSDPVPWMARASVFVLSSRYEGLGNVLVEAMGVGTPVVATDCPSGPAEILENGRFGPLVPVDDTEAMARAIRTTLDTPPARELLLEGARRFHSGRIAEQYLEVLGLESQGGGDGA